VMEAALPLLGTAIIFGLILPAAALVARGALWLLNRHQPLELNRLGALRYALLVGSTAIPLAWFISACVYQVGGGTPAGVCVVPDPPGVPCPEVAALAGVLLLFVAATACPPLSAARRALRATDSREALAVRSRIVQLAQGHTDLTALLRRLVVVGDGQAPIATLGLFRPHVTISTAFADQLDDGALLAALKHEAQHLRDRDPLRYALAWWALTLNPLGRWLLGPELRRWILTRETHCDREAVLSGASPAALAHALIEATRFSNAQACAALRATDARVLRLRVGLLMAYEDRRPLRWKRVPALSFVVCGLLVALVMPHVVEDGALDALHRTAEKAGTFLAGR